MAACLETERLWLRPHRQDDLTHFLRFTCRPAFYRFLPIDEPTPKSVRQYLEGRIAEHAEADRTGHAFVIEPKAVGHAVGDLRLEVRDAQSRSGPIGYGLDADFEGHGYMTEAVRAVLEFGFDQLGLHRIWAGADVDNEKSWQLLARVGMKREGLMRDEKLIRGVWRNSYLYAIVENDRIATGPCS